MKYTTRILKLIVTCVFSFCWLLLCCITAVFLLALIGAVIQLNFSGIIDMFVCAAIAAVIAGACTDLLVALLKWR